MEIGFLSDTVTS